VTLEFEWQRRATPRLFQEDEYICPQALADHLISRLHATTEPDQADANTLYVFSPDGTRVAIRRTDLVPM
jgi:hypothetical protein